VGRFQRWRAEKRSIGRTPTLSLCVITAGEPERVRRLLEVWRPHVDEVFLALDERGPHEAIVSAVGGLADRTAILPAMPGMERSLGWAHAQCTGDWILRVDDDELPSRALSEALPSLLAERELTHVWLPRRWVHPSPGEAIAQGPWERDTQLRLVRNQPGSWRFSGRSNIQVEGAGRIADAPLLHLVLLLNDVERRRASMDHLFIPEDVEDLPAAPMDVEDTSAVATFLARLDEERPGGRGRRAPAPLRPTTDELERWNEDRPVPHGA
jgi:hypothetical protein